MKKRSELAKGKRGQLTLFIIVAIMILAVSLIFLLWVKPKIEIDNTRRLGFEGCVGDLVEQATEELAPKAGFINAEFVYEYNGEKIPYLCYTNEYYKVCTIQKPFLKQHFEEQLELLVKEKVNICYENSINELKAQGYDVENGKVEYNISLEPGKIRTTIEAPTKVGSGKYTRFNVETTSAIYEMLMIATSILQYETKYGDSNTDSYRILYPDYLVDKMKRGDGTTVYTIESKIYKTKFKFASRSLPWPAGYK